MELRGLSLRIRLQSGQPELSAGRVRFAPQGRVLLAQGVTWKEVDGTTVEAEEAELQTTGSDAGQLILHPVSGPVMRRIFGQANLPVEAKKRAKQASN